MGNCRRMIFLLLFLSVLALSCFIYFWSLDATVSVPNSTSPCHCHLALGAEPYLAGSRLPSVGMSWNELDSGFLKETGNLRERPVLAASALEFCDCDSMPLRDCLSVLFLHCLWNMIWNLARNHSSTVSIFFKSRSSLRLTIISLKIRNIALLFRAL